MGNGALLMRALGHDVLGADQNTYPPMSDRLAEAGIRILEGYDAGRLQQLRPDLVVVGNVNTRGNPEVEWLLDTRAIPFVSLPDLLSRELLARRPAVVVAGTHGKTTTTTMTACLLRAAGVQPGYLIGGVPLDLPSGAEPGAPDAPFVIEGDEYDSAFFDKRSKFIHYCPRTLVLNNLEFDHADIFRDLEDVRRTFSHLIKLVPRSGAIICNSDDAQLESLVHVDWAPVLRVGLGERADLRIHNFQEHAGGSSFDLVYRGRPWGTVEWQLCGLFNARNAAMAAMAAAHACGLADPTALSLSALQQFRGVKRRQEILLQQPQCTLISDFAHHPTAVRATLESLRARYPQHRLIAAMEARSNTACRNTHEAAFELALDTADSVHLGAVFRPERYPSDQRIDFSAMAARLGSKATAHHSNSALQQGLLEMLRTATQACIVVFFSNGSFDGVPAQLATALQTRSSCNQN
jgi:UDP-N-acetylmuramate: L-alanyl-gamma-D-glutamyl-meso-diaminopimelate ligase